MKRHIFLVGPGGVGKSTTGRLLGPLLGRRVVDLDEEFCGRVENITVFLEKHGYAAYFRRNSALFRELLAEQDDPALLVLSSGFLETDEELDLVRANRELVKAQGTSVLLMPSEDFAESLRIVVDRQMQRPIYLNSNRERQGRIFSARFGPYSELADVRVFGTGTPAEIAMKVVDALVEAGFRD